MFEITDKLPIFEVTQKQLAELVTIRQARGDLAATPVTIVASIIHQELLKEKRK